MDERTFREVLVNIDTSAVTEILIYPKSQNHNEVKLFKAKEDWMRVLGDATDLLTKVEAERQTAADLLVKIREVESRIFTTSVSRKYQCKPLRPWVSRAQENASVPDFVYAEADLEHPAIPGLILNKEERQYSSYLEIEDLVTKQVRFETMAEKSARINWVSSAKMI